MSSAIAWAAWLPEHGLDILLTLLGDITDQRIFTLAISTKSLQSGHHTWAQSLQTGLSKTKTTRLSHPRYLLKLWVNSSHRFTSHWALPYINSKRQVVLLLI